jgi:Trk K+ transport system NAD-binding subunit
MYRSLQLFALNSGDLDSRAVPWTLDIARFLAPAVTVAFVAELLRSAIHSARERPLSRRKGHVIVCGLGRTGGAVVKRLAVPDPEGVVAITADSAQYGVAAARALGVPIIEADATSPDTLRRAGIAGCRAVIALAGNDATNAEIAQAAAPSRSAGVRVLVGLRDRRLARELARHPEPPAEVLNLPALLARHAIAQVDERLAHGATVLIVGFGTLGQAIAIELAARGADVRVVAVDRTAGSKGEAILAGEHGLEDRLDSHACEFDSRAFERLEFIAGETNPVAVFITIKDEPAAVRLAFQLRAEPRLKNASVLVRVDAVEHGLATLLDARDVGIEPFGPADAAAGIIGALPIS